MISEAGSPSLKKGKEALTEPTMETLARRLDRVERENRWLKRAGVIALAVITAVVLMGQATPSSKVDKVEIVGETGSMRLGVSPEGYPRLVFVDRKGINRMGLWIGPHGWPFHARVKRELAGWITVGTVEALIPPLLTGWFAPGHGRCPSCKSPAFWRRPG